MEPIAIAQFGMGPIGVESIRLAEQMPWARIVGAVDIDPAKIGRPLAELTGIESLAGARIHGSFEELWSHVKPAVVLHTAGSKAVQSIEQITTIVHRGVSVASTCEELLYPKLRAAEAAASIDALAKQTGARIVGTGVNPGFVMDVLPVFLTGVSRNVSRIAAQRVVNASTRRMPLQRKIGSGLEPDSFRKLFAEGKAGHAGFRESVALIAHCMDWILDEVTETCEPVIARQDIQTEYFNVARGLTCGLHQHCIGKMKGEVKIDLELKMFLDADDPHDAVQIAGDPPLDVLVRGGVAGDHATVAALVNVVPRLLQAPAGMRLMTELPVPAWAGRSAGASS
jgi:4-hydroxy-tetrahydrodipicolinate reductase